MKARQGMWAHCGPHYCGRVSAAIKQRKPRAVPQMWRKIWRQSKVSAARLMRATANKLHLAALPLDPFPPLSLSFLPSSCSAHLSLGKPAARKAISMHWGHPQRAPAKKGAKKGAKQARTGKEFHSLREANKASSAFQNLKYKAISIHVQTKVLSSE